MKRIHLCLDIQGYLMNHTRKRDYVGMLRRADGRPMSADEAKAALLSHLASGKKVLPMSKECDNFNFETGCQGHEVIEKENS